MSGCRTGPLRTVRVSTLPRFVLAPLYLAEELGFFRDVGLELDIQPLADTTQMIPLLAGGRIDVTFAGATAALFNAIANGATKGSHRGRRQMRANSAKRTAITMVGTTTRAVAIPVGGGTAKRPQRAPHAAARRWLRPGARGAFAGAGAPAGSAAGPPVHPERAQPRLNTQHSR